MATAGGTGTGTGTEAGLRMSELLVRMQDAGIVQAEIDGVFDATSPKRAAMVLLEQHAAGATAEEDPAMELHQLALEAEMLLGSGGQDEIRAAKAEMSQGESQSVGSPLAEQLSQLARAADDLTSPRAKLEHVYDRLSASSPPHEDAPQVDAAAVRPRADQSPLTPSTSATTATTTLASQVGAEQQPETSTDLGFFAPGGGSASTWLSNLSSSISELEGIATTPSRSSAKPKRSSSRPAPPPRDAKRSPAVPVASPARTVTPTGHVEVTPRAALAPLPAGQQQFPPGSLAERIARASAQPDGTPPGGSSRKKRPPPPQRTSSDASMSMLAAVPPRISSERLAELATPTHINPPASAKKKRPPPPTASPSKPPMDEAEKRRIELEARRKAEIARLRMENQQLRQQQAHLLGKDDADAGQIGPGDVGAHGAGMFSSPSRAVVSHSQAHQRTRALDTKSDVSLHLSTDEKHEFERAAILGSLAQAMASKRTVFGKTIEDARAAFAAFDRDGSGTLTPDELTDALTRLGLGLSDSQIADIGVALDVNGDGQIDYSELAGFANGDRSPVPAGGKEAARPASPAWSARSGTSASSVRRTATASPTKPVAVRSLAASKKHVDAMKKRQDAKHAEFERKKRVVEEERLAKESAELSFQPNVARREIEALYAKHNPEKLSDLDSLLAKYGEKRLLAILRKKYLGSDAHATRRRKRRSAGVTAPEWQDRLLNWAKQRAADREREEQRRKAQAAKDRLMSHIPTTNHSKRRGKGGGDAGVLRYADPATVAGARLYGNGVQWQRKAAEQMAKQQAQRKAEEDMLLRSTPEINARSKELAESKEEVKVKRVVHDLDAHQSSYLKTVEEKRGKRAKTFKNAAKVEQAIAERIAKDEAAVFLRRAQKEAKMVKVAEEAAETVATTLRDAEETKKLWKPPPPPTLEAPARRSPARRSPSPRARTLTRREMNKAEKSYGKSSPRSPQRTKSPVDQEQSPQSQRLSLVRQEPDPNQSAVPAFLLKTSPVNVPRSNQHRTNTPSSSAEKSQSDSTEAEAAAEPEPEGGDDGTACVNVSAIGLRGGLAKDIRAAIEQSGNVSSPLREQDEQKKREAQDLARRTQLLKQRAAEQAKVDRFEALARQAAGFDDSPRSTTTEDMDVGGEEVKVLPEVAPGTTPGLEIVQRPPNMPPLPAHKIEIDTLRDRDAHQPEELRIDADAVDQFVELLIELLMEFGLAEQNAEEVAYYLEDLGIVSASQLSSLPDEHLREAGLLTVQIRKLRAALEDVIAYESEARRKDRERNPRDHGQVDDAEAGDDVGGGFEQSYGGYREDDYPSPVSTIPEGSHEGETESERDELSPYPRAEQVQISPPRTEDTAAQEHVERDTGSDDAGETVVFPEGPLGLRVVSNENFGLSPWPNDVHPTMGIFGTVLEGFTEMEPGTFSAAQASGRVYPGDFIVAVNDTPMAGVQYDQVIEEIMASMRPMRLTFCSPDVLLQKVAEVEAAASNEPDSSAAEDADQVEAEPTIESSSEDDTERKQPQPYASAGPSLVLEPGNDIAAPGVGTSFNNSGETSPEAEMHGRGGMSPLGELDWEKGIQSALGDKFIAPEVGTAAHDRFLTGAAVRCNT
eukprot:COSAG02_NODE_1397_length_12873_cov_18.498043_5_plen_1610_part_00